MKNYWNKGGKQKRIVIIGAIILLLLLFFYILKTDKKRKEKDIKIMPSDNEHVLKVLTKMCVL